ncbi:MAG: hypothetical protein MK098_02590 [Marinovum sp.]|nr:hypothetical protein [Marinovum sp.]
MIKTFLTAAALLVIPSLSLAMGCSSGKHYDQTAMSCAEGMVYDAQSGTCISQIG